MGVCVFQNIHISHQCLQMVSSKAHVQLTPFSLQESLTLHKNSLEANTTQMMDSRLERQSWDEWFSEMMARLLTLKFLRCSPVIAAYNCLTDDICFGAQEHWDTCVLTLELSVLKCKGVATWDVPHCGLRWMTFVWFCICVFKNCVFSQRCASPHRETMIHESIFGFLLWYSLIHPLSMLLRCVCVCVCTQAGVVIFKKNCCLFMFFPEFLKLGGWERETEELENNGSTVCTFPPISRLIPSHFSNSACNSLLAYKFILFISYIC